MTFVVTVALRFKAETSETFWQDELPGLQAETRAFPGVLSVRALRKSDQAVALFVDVFEDAAASEAYFAWRRSTGVFDRLAALLVEPPRIDHWPVGIGDAWLEADAPDAGACAQDHYSSCSQGPRIQSSLPE